MSANSYVGGGVKALAPFKKFFLTCVLHYLVAKEAITNTEIISFIIWGLASSAAAA